MHFTLPLKSHITSSFKDSLTPHIFTFELTTVCNNFCSACANVELSREKRNRKLHAAYVQNWDKVIDAIAPFAKVVRLSGGEPTLHKDFENIVAYLEEKKLPHALLTDGRWTVNKPQQIIEIYQKCEHFLGMLMSLHGSNAVSHNAFVESTANAFEETYKNIALAAAHFEVFISCVLTKHSCEEIDEILTIASKLNVKGVIFNRFIAPENHALMPTKQQFYKAVMKINDLQTAGTPCTFGNHIPLCFAPIQKQGSKAGFESCHVSPTGLVRPHSFSHSYWGNINEEGIENIWQSSTAKTYRTELPQVCEKCEVRNFCRGAKDAIHLVNAPYVFNPTKQNGQNTLLSNSNFWAMPSDA